MSRIQTASSPRKERTLRNYRERKLRPVQNHDDWLDAVIAEWEAQEACGNWLGLVRSCDVRVGAGL